MLFDVLNISIRVVRVHCLLTIFTLDLEVLTLLHAMVLHIPGQDAEAAALLALEELVLTFLEMDHSLYERAGKAALRLTAFKFKLKQILLHVPMHVLKLHSIIPSTLLGA